MIRYDVGGLRGLWTPSLEWGQGRGRASWLVQPRRGWRADGGCSELAAAGVRGRPQTPRPLP